MIQSVLELNDADMQGYTAVHGAAFTDIACIDTAAEPWTFGLDAAKSARIRPMAVSFKHFSEIDAPHSGALALPGVELAYRQLRQCAARLGSAPLAVLVSGAWTLPQLGLLLGAGGAAGLRIEATIDLAVAAAISLPTEGRVLAIDVELDRCVVTELHIASGRVERRRVAIVPEAGLRPLLDAWTRGFAERMVTATRFDPMFNARSEQSLFDQMPGWLERLTGGETISEAAITQDADSYAIEFTPAQAAADAAAAFGVMVAALHRFRHAGQRGAILVGSRAARLPGLLAALAEFADCDVWVAPPGTAAINVLAGAAELAEHAETPTLRVAMTHRPRVGWRAERAMQDTSAGEPATHLIYAGRAMALDGEPLRIGKACSEDRCIQLPEAAAAVSRSHCSVWVEAGAAFVLDHSRFGTYLNDERIDGRAILRAGDRLGLGDPRISLDLVRMS
jgi:hypothetical protein